MADEVPEPFGSAGDNAAFDGFPEEAVLDSAESPRFTRGDAMAWSVVWHLDSEAAAKAAEAKLAEQAFVERFLAGTGADVTGRHAVLAGRVHLDLLPLRRGTTLALLVLGDSPDPFPDADSVAARLRSRLE
jgi:hypothetical protein